MSKMINVGREVKHRDYEKSKDGKPVYKTETKFPELTIVGKPELGQLPYGKEIVVKVKLKSTGFGERSRWDCCSDSDAKVPEATFDILEMEVPEGAMPVKLNVVKGVKPGTPIEDGPSKPMEDDD